MKIKTIGIGLLFLAAAAALRLLDPYPIEVLRLKGLDYYQRNQEKIQSENIAVVEIDEKSLEKNGQWPWKRDELAAAIRKAYDSGASLVVLPIIFAEPDRLGGDDAFVATLSEMPVITSQSASLQGKGNPVPRGIATVGGKAQDWIYDYPAAIGPIQSIGEASAGVGMLLVTPELDGVVRRLPLIVQVQGETYPTLPLEVTRLFGDQPSYQAKVTDAGVDAIRVVGMPPVKTDANARVWINFKYTFPSISYAQDDWSELKDKVVIIAPTAEGLANTVATPLGTSYGYELNLQVLQMMIDQDGRLERPAEFDLYELMFGGLLAAIAVICIAGLGYVLNGVIFAVFVTAPVVLGSTCFRLVASWRTIPGRYWRWCWHGALRCS